MHSGFLRTAMVLVVGCLLAAGPARAAEPKPFTAAELDQILAPIVLFPDALLSQALMASTYPSDVAQAVDWAYAHRKLEGDAAVQAVQDKAWDPSVQSLVAFPQVLAMFGENPQWVHDLGDAFLAQPGEVMDSVQFLRAKAKACRTRCGAAWTGAGATSTSTSTAGTTSTSITGSIRATLT